MWTPLQLSRTISQAHSGPSSTLQLLPLPNDDEDGGDDDDDDEEEEDDDEDGSVLPVPPPPLSMLKSACWVSRCRSWVMPRLSSSKVVSSPAMRICTSSSASGEPMYPGNPPCHGA